MDTSESIKFDLLMNYANEFLIVFPELSGQADHPRFVYDVKAQKALLLKDGRMPSVAFFPLPEEATESLSNASRILCVETKENAIHAEYYATVETK